MPRTPAYPTELISRVADEAGASARTVLRYLQGVAVWPTTRKRVETALRAAGRNDLVREAPAGTAAA